MKKILLSMLCLSVLVFALAGTSQAWQGRMGGAGDPYGLLQDESDFLIHPAKIANGEGIKFYGHYRFTYTDVMDWDYDLDQLTPAGMLTNFYYYETSGQEYSHNALLGAATPLGPGRFGIFFTYDGMRGDYDGDEDAFGISNYAEYDLSSDFDNFALRLLYGLPIGGFNVGGEVQFGYRQEANETWIQLTDLSTGIMDYPWGGSRPFFNLFPFMFPYNSDSWETLLKGSLEGTVGPLDLEFTLRGGFIFGGDNDWAYDYQQPAGISVAGINLDGDVHGWSIGGDLWVRYPVDTLVLPFLVRIDYQSKTRDGDGEGYGGLTGDFYNYEQETRNLHLEAGGGIEKALSQNARVAAGLYYNYLQGRENLRQWGIEGVPFTNEHDGYPAATEHRVMFRLAGEAELSPMVTLRMGLVPFYGWVREDFTYYYSFSNYTDDISLSGSRWGIGGSLGGSLQFGNFTMEPFINGGWQQIDLAGDGERNTAGVVTDLWGMDLARSEWYIGGGCSFVYDMP